MAIESKGIYHWKLGDVAMAKICKKVYARVRVIKDEKGLFFDDKVLGISCNEDESLAITKELCYYVETCRTNEQLWLPYTCMHLADRSRPFYGTEKISPGKVKTEPSPIKTPRKRKPQEEHIVPLQVKLSNIKKPDFNATYEIQHVPQKSKYENAFKEFVRRGKEHFFDQYFELLKLNVDKNKDSLEFLMTVDSSTEDKLELLLKNTVSEKELDNYLKQCWRYNLVQKQTVAEPKESRELSDITNSNTTMKTEVTVHIPWCLVCGKDENLRACTNCPASYHLPCRREWLLTIIHRKKTPEKFAEPVTFIRKILSSTRTKCSVQKEKENIELCPSCMWGPKVGYDDVVWHKLGPCPWWPAKVLTPGDLPSCLLTKSHSPHDWPLRYYGTLNHSWGSACRICLFLPSHTKALASREEIRRDAIMDACDDYISVYLT